MVIQSLLDLEGGGRSYFKLLLQTEENHKKPTV
jgi:hypothetical protein